MFDLVEWQNKFLWAVISAPDKEWADVSGLHCGHQTRLQIYRDNYLFGLLDVLTDVFEVTADMLGAEAFKAQARDFIWARPPASGDRGRYGADFADFLAGRPALTEFSFISDLTRLEWAMHEAHHADDAPELSIEDLVSGLAITAHPSTRLVEVKHNVFELFQSYHRRTLATFELARTATHYLVWRDADDDVVCKSLSDAELSFANAVMTGGRLEDILLVAKDVDMQTLQTFLAQTLGAGLYIRKDT